MRKQIKTFKTNKSIDQIDQAKFTKPTPVMYNLQSRQLRDACSDNFFELVDRPGFSYFCKNHIPNFRY